MNTTVNLSVKNRLLVFSLFCGIIGEALLCFLAFHYAMILALTLLNLIALGLLLKLVQDQHNRFKEISSAVTEGRLPEVNQKELNHPIINDLHKVHNQTSEIVQFIKNLDSEDFEFKFLDPSGMVGQSLLGVAEKQKQYNEEERIRSWKNNGLAKFGEILRANDKNLDVLCFKILKSLVKYVDAGQGAFFLEQKEEGERFMQPMACYAFERRKMLKEKVYPGQGLIGQVMQDKDIIYVNDVPQNFINIKSGLGGALPGNIVIVPLLLNDEFYGAIELASFKQFETYKIEFLQAVAENITSVITSVQSSLQTVKLLEESQKAGEELRLKEEEMLHSLEELQATQEEMTRKEEELSGLFSALNSSMGVVELDQSGELITANGRMEQLTGFDRGQLTAQSDKLFPPNEKKKIVAELVGGKKQLDKEFTFQTRSGSLIWLNINYSTVNDRSGQFKKALLLIQDTTVKKQKEKEFERLSLVADNTDNSVIITNPDGFTEFVNKGFTEITGYTLEEMAGKKPGHILQGEETNQETVEMIRTALKNKESVYAEILNYKKDGTTYWVSLTINPVTDEDGEVFKYIAVQADITETKKKALDYRYKLEAIGRSNAIIEFDVQGNILDVNDNYLSIFNYEKEELIDRHHSVFVPADLKESESYQELWKKLASGEFVDEEFLRVDKSGNLKYLRGIYNPIYDLNGKLVKVIKFATDITKEKELQEKSKEQQNELSAHLETINKTIATIEFDHEGYIRDVNQIYLDVSGYTKEELVGKAYDFLLPQEEIEKPQHAMMWQSIKGGNYFSGQFKQTSKKGEMLWLLGTFNPLMNAENKLECIKMFGQFNTLDVNKQLELSQMLDAFKSSTATVELSVDGKLKKANEKFHQDFNISKMALRKTSLQNIFNFDGYSEEIEKVLKKISKEVAFEEFMFESEKEGVLRSYQAYFNPIKNANDEVEKVLLILKERDIKLNV